MGKPVYQALLSCALLCAAAQLATHVAGQGLIPSKGKNVGATSTYAYLQQLYSRSKAYKQAYKQRPASACSNSNSNSVCAAAATNDALAQVTLMMAASPQVYSSTQLLSPEYAGDVALVAAPMDQRPCDSCAAFAVASAAETAMAVVLGVDVAECSISVQALHFCPVDGSPGTPCTGGASLNDMLKRLASTSSTLPINDCMGYNPSSVYDVENLCTSRCKAPNKHAAEGQFQSQIIRDTWQAQLHIRQYGAVVTRFNIMSDFRPFFQKYSNARKVYKPGQEAIFLQYHAVVLVGYNNEDEYWLAKNSWGPDWADGGFFRVAYNECSVLTPSDGEAYGIIWTPKTVPAAQQLPLAPGPSERCYTYQASAGDYMAKVAWLAKVPLEKFLLDNVATVKDLDASLQGKQLLVCNPAKGSYVLPDGASDPQLEALLRIKAAMDTANTLKEWNRKAGENMGYCSWRGVVCHGQLVTDLIMRSIGNFPELLGTLPSAAAFTGLPGLTGRLYVVDQHSITGPIPSDWAKLVQIVDIRLLNNSLTGTIPPSLGNMVQLKNLYLASNKLTGQLPDSFTKLQALEEFDGSRNQLTGPIPAWSGLSRLIHLYLYGNRLTGQLPDSFKGLTSLEELQFGSNKLSGTIPAWLGTNLGRLNGLSLSDNALTGTIPASLGNLKQLKRLFLHGNKLTGTLPLLFGSMTALTTADFSNNPQLGGCLPAAWKGKGTKFNKDNTQVSNFC